MADETISTRIVANADFSALIADVHKVTASLSKLQEKLASSNKMMANQIAVMNRSFSDTLRSTGQFSTHFVSLTSDVEKFGKNLDGGKLKLNQYFNAFRDQTKTSGGLIRDLAKQQVALQNSVLQPLGRNAQGLMQFNVQVPRGLDTVKNAAAIARTELQIMNKVVQDGAGQIINFGKNTQWTGRQLTVGLTVPLVAFGNAAAKAFREADQELVRLTKVYGDVAGTSSAELGKVRDDVVQTAKEISQAMGVSFKETIGLAADIAATGKTGDELLGSVRETTRLAVLGEVDRQEAMKATLAIQSAFKSNTDELAESINFLNAVENQTSTTLNDLVEAIPKAGPIVKGLGGDVQDLALYLTAMREGGINASEGANALKSALASLINPTDVAVKKFEGLGIDLLGVVNNNAGDLTGTLMALQGALDNLDPLQKQQAIEQLFGKFQFSRLNALFENLGREGSQTLKVLDLMKESSEGLADVADRELTAVTESASGKYRRALEGLKASLAEVGEQFLQINTVLITVIDKVVQFAMNLPGPVKQILALIGGVTAIAGPLIMLTGLLANFFGNMAKGVFHVKAFLKGGEGFKYLTPEMLAAEKAGKLVEQSFYSDAKAAAVLQQALRNLLDEFSLLEAKAKSGSISVNPAVSTMAGNLVMGSGGRVVDPSHPLVGKMGTRASSHMVPRSGMTEAQRLQQTMFGMVPGSGPVNQKIGQNPQIYMNDNLPEVAGLTTVGGVSTGVVAAEAARHHAMMATLGMQSKAEIDALKKQMVATGVLSKDFMNQFDDILPIVSKLTDNAARESALIVSELRAGKLNVEQAKAKIIALNLETERMLSSSMQAQATSMGRTLNPTIIPTLNQPVVDPTGKSNMRELFKKGSTRDFINKVAGALGVRTSGAGYNIETTKPRRMNSGGYVYTMNDGNIVPGPNVNADVVPAMLTPGEFVVNAESTRQNLPLLQAINGRGSSGPGFNKGTSSGVKFQRGHAGDQMPGAGVDPSMFGGGTRSVDYIARGVPIWMTDSLNQRLRSVSLSAVGPMEVWQEFATGVRAGRHPFEPLATIAQQQGLVGEEAKLNALFSEMMNDLSDPKNKDLQFKGGTDNSFEKWFNKNYASKLSPDMKKIWNSYGTAYGRRGSRSNMSSLGTVHIDKKTGSVTPLTRGNPLARGIPLGILGSHSGSSFNKNRSLLSRAMSFASGKNIRNPAFLGAGLAAAGRFAPGRRIPGAIRFNQGGMVPGYSMGGMVPAQNGNKYNMGGMVEGYNRGGMIRGLLPSLAVGMGGNMLGQQVGGGAGTAISMASMIASMGMGFGGMGSGGGMMSKQMEKIPAQLKQPIGPLNNLAQAASKTGGSLSGILRIFGPLLKGFATLLKLTSPIGLAFTGVTATVAFLIKRHKEHTEELRINRTAFGMTSEAAAKAGYKYTDYNKQIKTAIEDAKALKAQNKMIYESMTKANIPIHMTIEQYKKLKVQVKSTMQDYIKLFDQTDRKDVGQTAIQLKAQFMAAGDSAEVATSKVYALIDESNKAAMAGRAIGTQAFQNIQTLEQAAAQSAKTFESALKVSDAEGQAAAMLSSFAALDGSIDETVRKSEELAAKNEGVAKSVGQATIEQINAINASYKNQSNLTKGIISEIGKANPELAEVLNSTDTVVSAFAKLKLLVQGTNIDVSSLSGTAAIAAIKLSSIVQDTVKTTGAVGLQYGKYKQLTEQIKSLQTAQKGQSAKAQIDSREAIASLNKQIDQIKKAAQDKVNGIRKATEAENSQLEIQKSQLRAQQALASGNMTGYAEEMLNQEQILNEANRKSAEEAIMLKAELDIKPLQDQIDRLSNKNQKLADKAALAGDELGKLQKRADTLNTNLNTYSTAISNIVEGLITIPKFKDSPEYQEALTALGVFAKRLGIQTKPQDLVDELKKSMMDINANQVNLYAKQINENRVSYPKTSPLDAEGLGLGKLATRDGGVLTDDSKKKIVQEGLLNKDDYFEYKGKMYRVKSVTYVKDSEGKQFVNNMDVVQTKSLGGPVVAGQKYMVNDRVNPLGYQGEGFIPNMSGTIYPNIATMPRYDIPSGTQMSGANVNSNPSSSNVYNIDIALNGTNVTVDDVMRSFKRELALVNAKEGIDRRVGGMY
jgi:TP901 family phage tail tape measure protein